MLQACVFNIDTIRFSLEKRKLVRLRSHLHRTKCVKMCAFSPKNKVRFARAEQFCVDLTAM